MSDSIQEYINAFLQLDSERAELNERLKELRADHKDQLDTKSVEEAIRIAKKVNGGKVDVTYLVNALDKFGVSL